MQQKHEEPSRESLEEMPEIDWSKAKVIGRGLKMGRTYTLALLRRGLGKTQIDIAEAAKMAQGDVSRLEAREDAKVSTLARYAEALGGKLEIAVVMSGGRRYKIDMP